MDKVLNLTGRLEDRKRKQQLALHRQRTETIQRIAQCASCHFTDKMDARFGPGLLNLLKNETLPSSNRPATVENVRRQIVQPYRSMPAFAGFSENEMADLLAYLKTL